MQRAVARLRERLVAEGKETYFRVFEARTRFDGEKPAEYAAIAKELGLAVYDVRNYLSAARKAFRQVLLELAGETADDPKSELNELGLGGYV